MTIWVIIYLKQNKVINLKFLDIEGAAGDEGISYEGDNFEVSGTYKKNKIKIEVDELEDKKWSELNLFEKIDDKLTDIPYLRGVADLYKERQILFFSSISLISFLMEIPQIYVYLLYFLFELVDTITFRFSQASKYHAAEHMAINMYEEGLPLNIENVRIQDRYHSLCSTNYLIVLIAILLIGIVMNAPLFISIIFGLSMRHELIDYIDDHKQRFKILHSLLKMIQIPLYTSTPEDKHLKLATKTLDKLIKLESNIKY